MDNLEAWDEAGAEEVSVDDLNQAVQIMVDKKKAYEEAKKVSDGAYAERKEAEELVLNLLDKAKMSKYYCEGIGTAYTINKLSVRVPKDHKDKKALFDYIKETQGDDVLLDYLSIHSARLNSFYNEQVALASEHGHGDFKLPGVGEPSSNTSIGFRKKG